MAHLCEKKIQQAKFGELRKKSNIASSAGQHIDGPFTTA